MLVVGTRLSRPLQVDENMRRAHERNAASEGKFLFPSNIFNEPEHDGSGHDSDTVAGYSRSSTSGGVGCSAAGGGGTSGGGTSSSANGEWGSETGGMDNGGVHRPRDFDPLRGLEEMTVLQILEGKVGRLEAMFGRPVRRFVFWDGMDTFSGAIVNKSKYCE